MFDLLSHAVPLPDRGDGRKWMEFPSISFVKLCEQYIAAHPEYRHAPL
jgi:hypothetical protein